LKTGENFTSVPASAWSICIQTSCSKLGPHTCKNKYFQIWGSS